MKPQLTVVLLLQTIKNLSPAVGSEDLGNSLNLSWEHRPPFCSWAKAPTGELQTTHLNPTVSLSHRVTYGWVYLAPSSSHQTSPEDHTLVVNVPHNLWTRSSLCIFVPVPSFCCFLCSACLPPQTLQKKVSTFIFSSSDMLIRHSAKHMRLITMLEHLGGCETIMAFDNQLKQWIKLQCCIYFREAHGTGQGLALGGGAEGRDSFAPQLLSVDCLSSSLTLSSISSCIDKSSQLQLTQVEEWKEPEVVLQAMSSIQQQKA